MMRLSRVPSSVFHKISMVVSMLNFACFFLLVFKLQLNPATPFSFLKDWHLALLLTTAFVASVVLIGIYILKPQSIMRDTSDFQLGISSSWQGSSREFSLYQSSFNRSLLGLRREEEQVDFSALEIQSMVFSREEARALDCAICLEKFKAQAKLKVLECAHTFHRKCLKKWH